MANRYSKKQSRKIEPVPLITTIMVIAVCIFIAVDSTTSGGTGPIQDNYILRVELSSVVHENLNGTLTFEITDGIYEQVQLDNDLRYVFTTKFYRGQYTLSFDGAGVTFGPISIMVQNIGTVYDGETNDIHIKIDAVEG